MAAICVVVTLVLIWAFFPESGAEWSKNFISSRNEKWKKIFGLKVEEDNNED